MRQCHVLGFVKLKFKSLIKASGHYSVQGVYHALPKGRGHVSSSENLPLPKVGGLYQPPPVSASSSTSSIVSSQKKKRIGKGCHVLPVVRTLLEDSENRKVIEDKTNYQYLGTFPHPSQQQLYFVPDIFALEQTATDNPHFLWFRPSAFLTLYTRMTTIVVINSFRGNAFQLIHRSGWLLPFSIVR